MTKFIPSPTVRGSTQIPRKGRNTSTYIACAANTHCTPPMLNGLTVTLVPFMPMRRRGPTPIPLLHKIDLDFPLDFHKRGEGRSGGAVGDVATLTLPMSLPRRPDEGVNATRCCRRWVNINETQVGFDPGVQSSVVRCAIRYTTTAIQYPWRGSFLRLLFAFPRDFETEARHEYLHRVYGGFALGISRIE